jgi:hypothetical protein
MRRFLPLFLALYLPMQAQAEPTLPEAGALKAAESPEFLLALVNAMVAGEHCEGFEVSPEELALLTATVPVVVADMGIDTETYDLEYNGRSFADIFIDETCPRDGPKVRPMLDQLIGMGGAAG